MLLIIESILAKQISSQFNLNWRSMSKSASDYAHLYA